MMESHPFPLWLGRTMGLVRRGAAALGALVAAHYPVLPGNELRSVLFSAGNELLHPHRPGRLDFLSRWKASNPFGPLPLRRGEVLSKLPSGLFLHRILLAFVLEFMYDSYMAKSIVSVTHKRRPGRPATGHDPARSVRLSDEIIDRIEKWAARQDDKPPRSEAIRRLVERGLASEPAPTKPRRTKS